MLVIVSKIRLFFLEFHVSLPALISSLHKGSHDEKVRHYAEAIDTGRGVRSAPQ
jgi:hypothetical protein